MHYAFWLVSQQQKKVGDGLPDDVAKGMVSGYIVEVKDSSSKNTKLNSNAITAAYSSCKNKQVSWCGVSPWGAKIWCYFQKIDWCFNGAKVTSKTRTRWGEIYYPFWSWKNMDSSESGGVGSSYYRAYTVGEFKYCVLTYGCLQYKYPRIDITVYGDGTSKYTAGCG